MEKITLNWYGPYKIYNIDNHDVSYEKGIYAIYRIWGESEKLLYIGKTERDFRIRIKEHSKNWVNDVRGEIKLRFGVLEFEKGKYYSSKKLSDVEALLILWHIPNENTSSKKSYSGREKMQLINKGRKGMIDSFISTEQLEYW